MDTGHETLFWWLGGLSIGMFVIAWWILPIIVARLPVDYFHATSTVPGGAPGDNTAPAGSHWEESPRSRARPGRCGHVSAPGAGDSDDPEWPHALGFRGKRTLERRLVQQPSVWEAVNWIRARAHRPPLEMRRLLPLPQGQRGRKDVGGGRPTRHACQGFSVQVGPGAMSWVGLILKARSVTSFDFLGQCRQGLRSTMYVTMDETL